jgi:hypothetical protein
MNMTFEYSSSQSISIINNNRRKGYFKDAAILKKNNTSHIQKYLVEFNAICLNPYSQLMSYARGSQSKFWLPRKPSLSSTIKIWRAESRR